MPLKTSVLDGIILEAKRKGWAEALRWVSTSVEDGGEHRYRTLQEIDDRLAELERTDES